MSNEVKRRVQTERRAETAALADTLEQEGTLDLDRLNALIREEKDIVEWAQGARARSKNPQYSSNMAKAEENAKAVMASLRRAGKLFQNDRHKTAVDLLRQVAVTGSKVSKATPKSNVATLYLEYLAARDTGFQQWLKDGQPVGHPPRGERAKQADRRRATPSRRTSAAPSSNRPEDYER